MTNLYLDVKIGDIKMGDVTCEIADRQQESQNDTVNSVSQKETTNLDTLKETTSQDIPEEATEMSVNPRDKIQEQDDSKPQKPQSTLANSEHNHAVMDTTLPLSEISTINGSIVGDGTKQANGDVPKPQKDKTKKEFSRVGTLLGSSWSTSSKSGKVDIPKPIDPQELEKKMEKKTTAKSILKAFTSSFKSKDSKDSKVTNKKKVDDNNNRKKEREPWELNLDSPVPPRRSKLKPLDTRNVFDRLYPSTTKATQQRAKDNDKPKFDRFSNTYRSHRPSSASSVRSESRRDVPQRSHSALDYSGSDLDVSNSVFQRSQSVRLPSRNGMFTKDKPQNPRNITYRNKNTSTPHNQSFERNHNRRSMHEPLASSTFERNSSKRQSMYEPKVSSPVSPNSANSTLERNSRNRRSMYEPKVSSPISPNSTLEKNSSKRRSMYEHKVSSPATPISPKPLSPNSVNKKSVYNFERPTSPTLSTSSRSSRRPVKEFSEPAFGSTSPTGRYDPPKLSRPLSWRDPKSPGVSLQPYNP